jgi:flagellar basal-body rod protein FlgF
MIRGLYTSGWSMLVLNKKMDVLTNNLANVSTNGYKKDTVVLEGFPKLLARRLYDNTDGFSGGVPVGDLSFSNDVGEVYTNFQQGVLLKTDNSLDISIKDEGNAFFCVAVPQGDTFREYYTRDGGFELNANGQLVTVQGYFVLGENGVIQLEGNSFLVDRDGNITQNGVYIDRLLIKQFQDPHTLVKSGENLLSPTETTAEEEFTGQVIQNYIEQSNVDAVREMVDMISLMRSYEANQRIITAMDGTLEKAVNDVGRV